MNYYKKMAFVFALGAALAGTAWATDFYQLGYGQGFRTGRYDRQVGRAYQPGNYAAYKHGGSVTGSANKQAYRSGFMAGYNEGFGRGNDHHWRGHINRDDDRWERRRDGTGDGRPPGWDRGEKKGWGDCDLPPGQAKKDGCR